MTGRRDDIPGMDETIGGLAPIGGDDRSAPPADHVPGPTRERVAAVVRSGHSRDAGTVEQAISDDVGAVRAAAVSAAIRQATNRTGRPVAATKALLSGLTDDDPQVRRRSASMVPRWVRLAERTEWSDLGDVATALTSLLDDADERVVEVAAFACGELPLGAHAELVAAVVGSLARIAGEHPDPLCRESAVASLGSIGDPVSLPTVLDACRDRANVRRRAVLALAAFDDADATAELRRLTEDRDLQVRQAAEELLAIESGETT